MRMKDGPSDPITSAVNIASLSGGDVPRGHYAYMLLCADSTLYTGYAAQPFERAAAHNAKKGAKYTRSRLPVALVYYEALPDRSCAMRRERELKQLSRQEKLALISAQLPVQLLAELP